MPSSSTTMDPPNPSGVCQCGCGEPTAIAKATQASLGHIKGYPVRFLPNHHKRVPLDSCCELEDRGFTSPCWIWNRALDKDGYGRARGPRGRRGAHVVMYELRVGPVPDGQELDHLCRVRCCVNPDHLEPVTHLENVRRGEKVKLTRAAMEEILAHPRGVAHRHELATRFGVHPEYVAQIWRQADRAAAA